jgi:hypothetical protein
VRCAGLPDGLVTRPWLPRSAPCGWFHFPGRYRESVAEKAADDLDEPRRVGLEMQAQLPQPNRRPKDHPVLDRIGDAAEAVNLLADLPVALLIGAVAGFLWLSRKLRRPER